MAFCLQGLTRQERSTVLLRADSVLLELLGGVRARRADGGGGGGDVPLALPELVHQEGSFRRSLEVLQGGGRLGSARRLARPMQDVRQVRGLDFLFGNHDEQ